MKDIPVVNANVLWTCPECDNLNIVTTTFSCFTRFAWCVNCKIKVIPNTDEEMPDEV